MASCGYKHWTKLLVLEGYKVYKLFPPNYKVCPYLSSSDDLLADVSLRKSKYSCTNLKNRVSLNYTYLNLATASLMTVSRKSEPYTLRSSRISLFANMFVVKIDYKVMPTRVMKSVAF